MEAGFLTKYPHNILDSNLPIRPTDVLLLAIRLTWLVISLAKDGGRKARQLCGNNTRFSVRGCHHDRGSYRRFPLTKKIRQPFARVALTLFYGSVPGVPFLSPTRWYGLLSPSSPRDLTNTHPIPCFLLCKPDHREGLVSVSCCSSER